MFAIIEAGGKQLKVAEGEEVLVEKLSAEPKSTVEFNVLMHVDGDKSVICNGVKAKAEVIELVKGEKIIVYKYKAKKNVRKKNGHRQKYTKVKIISLG